MGVFKRWLLSSVAWAGTRIPVKPYPVPMFDDVRRCWGPDLVPSPEQWQFGLSQAQKNGIWLIDYVQRRIAAGYQEIKIPVGEYELPRKASLGWDAAGIALRWRDETTVRDRDRKSVV